MDRILGVLAMDADLAAIRLHRSYDGPSFLEGGKTEGQF